MIVEKTGTCKYCKQMKTVSVPEGADQETCDAAATDACECPEAKEEHRRRMKKEAAFTYIDNMLDKNSYARDVLKAAVEGVMNKAVGKVSTKIDKYTYTVDAADGEIKIKREFKESQEETF